MQDIAFGLPEDEEEDPRQKAWLKQPVLYDGLVVHRSTAFRLCAQQEQCWRFLDHVTELPEVEIGSRDELPLSLGAAYLAIQQRDIAYRNPGRDV